MKERRLDNTLPDELRTVLHSMGEDLTAARKVRKLTQVEMARRLNVTPKLVIRMEKGDATVSFGAYAAAAWIMGLEINITQLFSQERDPVFQREARLELPQRVRADTGSASDVGLDF